MALPWFKYIPDTLKGLVKSSYWKFIIGIPFLFSLLPTLSSMYVNGRQSLVSELDVYYSIFTLLFLGAILWSSFINRRLRFLAWLSLLFVTVTFIAQLFKLISAPVYVFLFSAIFKTSLIMIFFALALSWVKELVEELQIGAREIGLKLVANRKDGRSSYSLQIKGVPGKDDTWIDLTPASYEVLNKFCEKRISGEGWLELKPKNAPRGRVYDLNDYNQMKRLLHTILDGLFGANNWTRDKHELPLREAIFEWSEDKDRQVRFATSRHKN